jgi:hypothetical protein
MEDVDIFYGHLVYFLVIWCILVYFLPFFNAVAKNLVTQLRSAKNAPKTHHPVAKSRQDKVITARATSSCRYYSSALLS